jgi:DNA-directed RNA polymerase subunit RPC12/RpoP
MRSKIKLAYETPSMLYCEKCKKEVTQMGVSIMAKDSQAIVDSGINGSEKEGKIVMLNGPMFDKDLRCPRCGTELKERQIAISVIIPTWNETDNIEKAIFEIVKTLETNEISY